MNKVGGDPAPDPRIDAYIAARADFARPILIHLRGLIHAASPDIGETIKWSMPFFVYRGKNLCNMAAFKRHAAFGFWHGRHMLGGDTNAPDTDAPAGAMGQFGRLTGLADLPDDAALSALIVQAMARIDAGPSMPVAKPPSRAPLPIPPELAAAIAANPAAAAVWASFTPGKIRDYAEWVGEAKQVATRDRRIAQAVAWIAEGKARNWQYAKG